LAFSLLPRGCDNARELGAGKIDTFGRLSSRRARADDL
jgi:hypothetical protein